MSIELFISVFEKNVGLFPDKCAVMCGKDALSYVELNKKANTLAEWLKASDVKEGTVVGVLMDRGIHLLTSIIAIFKMRAVYMPLDGAYPQDRLNDMLEKSECKLLLTQGQHNEIRIVNDSFSVPAIGIEGLGLSNAENPSHRGTASDLAYIMFTSGTTGQPKGVMIEQQSLMNHLEVKVNDLDISHHDCVAETASPCFDISIWQFLTALTQGGTTAILDQRSLTDPVKMAAQMNEKNVSVIQLVPSSLCEFMSVLEAKSATSLASLRYISTAGEPLLPELCRRWLALYPSVPLLNHYGPTECADGVTHYMNRVAPIASQVHMPIGRPIKNLKAYLLMTSDKGLEEVKPGEVGELYLSGVGLARGYINDPQKTDSVFMANPFDTNDEMYSRLYRTGDLVREQENGLLDYLGRADRQVKLRGYRIELNEIENVINTHTAVKSSAVIVHCPKESCVKLTSRERIDTDQPPSILPRLVAYIEFSQYCSRSDLIDYLKSGLPEYMLPDRLLQLEKMPFNINGKLDYKSLPEPSEQLPILDNAYVEPSTEEQLSISRILSNILHIPRVGMDDYFLDLGGDSLCAMLAVNKIQNLCGVKVSIADLYQHTIGELVGLIQAKKSEVLTVPPLVKKDPAISEYPASHMQKHLWFLWQLDPCAANYTLQTALEWNGELDIRHFNHVWNKLLESYETLRIRFYQKDGELLCRFNKHEDHLMEYVDLSNGVSENFGAKMKALKSREFGKPFDIENANLYRAVLVKKAKNQYVIILTAHEIIIDAWSLSTIVRSLRDLYCDYDKASELLDARERITFSDFTVWEHQHLNQETLKDSKAFWDDQLQGDIPVLALPSDYKRPQRRHYAGQSQAITIRPEVANKLRGIARENKSTIFNVILTNFYILLHQYSGQNDIVVGSPHVTREQPGTENLMGFFLNMLPLRAKVDPSDTFIDMLSQSQKTVSGAVSHSLYPFSWMVDSLDIVRKSNISPVFQAMFTMYSERAEDVSVLNGEHPLSVIAKELEHGHTKYDLTLYCQEEGDAIYLQFSYCKDLYSGAMMKRMLANLETVITQVAQSPNTPLQQMDTLHSDEHTNLEAYNGHKSNYEERTLTELFEQQVKEHGPDTAFFWSGGSMDYQTLGDYVEAISANLYHLGVRANDKVLVGNDRGIDVVAMLLAIVKLKATYIIINETYPRLRTQEIIEDVQPRLFIVNSEQYNWVSDKSLQCTCTIVLFEQMKSMNTVAQTIVPQASEPHSELNQLLQIVYTSGSTGKPKGVKIPLKSCFNRLQWMWSEHPFKTGDVGVVQKSATRVASSWEIFGPLLQGVPSLLVSHKELLDPEVFMGLMNEHQVSHLLCSPSVLNNLLAVKEKSNTFASSLRFVTSSEECLPPTLAKQFKTSYPEVALYNFYGSSECSSNAAWYEVRSASDDDRCVPIGVPIANVGLAVTNEAGKALPQGAIGHIDVAGDCLAVGYLNDAISQNTKFYTSLGHCLANWGETVFRTGDLGRFNDNNDLEWLGRVDDQVQINGYRVELNEVSNLLQQHEAVFEAATVLLTNSRSPMLVAYVVLSNSRDDISEAVLQEHLQAYLLPHALPKSIYFMDTLPKLKSGKLDKQLLPEPDMSGGLHSRPTLQPLVSKTEKRLAAIWSRLLGIDNISGTDDFFSLGGASIASIRCVSDAAKIGLHFSVTDLYDYPVLNDLAFIIDEKLSADIAFKNDQPLIATPTMRFIAENMPSDEHWNMFGLWDASASDVDVDVLRDAFQQLTIDYPYLNTRIGKEAGQLQLVSSAEGITLEREMIGFFDTMDECEAVLSATTSAMQQTFLFDGKCPLVRLVWIDAEVEQQPVSWLFLVVHHYLIDGSGFRLLFDEIERYYDNKVSHLACAPVYQDGSQLNLWMENAMQALQKNMEKEIVYWASQPWPLLLGSNNDDEDKGHCVPSIDERNRLSETINQCIKKKEYRSEQLHSLCELNNEVYHFVDKVTTHELLDLNYFVHGFDAYDFILCSLVEEIGVGDTHKGLFIDSYDMHRGPTLGGIDLSKVMATAVQFVPLPLKINTHDSLFERIGNIHKQRREVLHHGLGLRLAKTLLGDECPRVLADTPWPKISINYRATLRTSRAESLLNMNKSTVWSGESLGLNEDHYHGLRISIDLENDHMRFHMRYDANTYTHAYISVLCEQLMKRLESGLEFIKASIKRNACSLNSGSSLGEETV